MTRIAEHLLLQAVDHDLVLIDQRSGAETIIPNTAIGPLAEAANYFHHQLGGDGSPEPPYGPGAFCADCGWSIQNGQPVPIP